MDIADYEPELKDSPSEAKQIFAAEISMLQWLLRGFEGYRGYNVNKLPDDFRERAYYNAALWRLVIDDLFPHLRDPRIYHILYAKYLILHLREHRFVPGDERGVITRSEVQARLYHRCKRYKARQAVKGDLQHLVGETKEVDQALGQAMYGKRPLVIMRDIPVKASRQGKIARMSSPGQSDILIQCAHGPCQRYISVHTKGSWCPECSEIEHHTCASIMIDEDEHGNKYCFKCHTNKQLYNMSE